MAIIRLEEGEERKDEKDGQKVEALEQPHLEPPKEILEVANFCWPKDRIAERRCHQQNQSHQYQHQPSQSI